MNPRKIVQALLLTLGATVPSSWAQTAPPPAVGGYLSGNWGIAIPAETNPTSVAFALEGPDRDEATTTFKWTNSPLFDVGGGLVLNGRFTVGAAFERSSDEQPANVVLTLSHPSFHPTLTASSVTEPLEHNESALHLEFGYRFPSSGPLAIRVFGGPTRFAVRQDVVSDLAYRESFNTVTRVSTASLEALETDSVKGSAWGYNVGVDASYFPTKYIGFGGLVRYTRATVDLENPLQSMIDDRRKRIPSTSAVCESPAGSV